MSSDENDKSTEQVLEYYKKYSQNPNLPRYFSGSSVSYLPPIAIEKDDNEPSQRETTNPSNQPVPISEINIIVDDSNNSSSSESPSEHKKLEWDNGADIGYDSARKNSEKKIQKSSSLPTLNKLRDLKPICRIPASKPSTIITHSTSSKNVEVLVYGDSNSSNQSSSKSSSSKQGSILSHSTESAKQQSSNSNTISTSKSKISSSSDSNETRIVDFQSTIDYLKHKIGLPGAHSTPNMVDNQLICNDRTSKSSLATLLSKNLSSKSKSDDILNIATSGSFVTDVNSEIKSSSYSSHSSSKLPMRKTKKRVETTKIVELSITTPINVNCKGLDVSSSDKTVQTFGAVQPKAVQTDDIGHCYMEMELNHEQKQKSVSNLDCENISEDVADLASSFEYISVDKNAKVLKLNKNRQDIISINSTTGISGVIKEISILKNSSESSNLSRTSSDDIDRHLEILHKLLKTKKMNSKTKRRYLKMLLKDLNELETSNDSTTSSELFIPNKDAVEREKVRSKPRVAFKESEDIMAASKTGKSRCRLPNKTYSSDEKDVHEHNQSSTLSSSPDVGSDTPKGHVKFADVNDQIETLELDLVEDVGSKKDFYQYKNVQLSKFNRDYKDSSETGKVEHKLTVDRGCSPDKQVKQFSLQGTSSESSKAKVSNTNGCVHSKDLASGSVHVHVSSEVGNVRSSQNQDSKAKISHSKHLPNTKSSSVEIYAECSSGTSINDENSQTSDQNLASQMTITQSKQFPSAVSSFAEDYTEYDTAGPRMGESVASLSKSSTRFYQEIGSRVKIMHSIQLPSAGSSTGSHHTKYNWDALIGESNSHTNKCVLQDQNVQTEDQYIQFNSRSVQSSVSPLQNAKKGESTQTSKPLLQDHSGQISNPHVSKATSTTEIPKSSSRSSSKYNTLRTDVTVSSSNSGSKDSNDCLLKFAENERAYQLNWINNEICHLSKLKSILELKSRSRSRTGESTRPKTREYRVIQKNASSKTSGRNYVIQTKLRVPTEENINYVLDGKEYVVLSSQKSTSDEDKATIANVQIKSNEKQTNIQVSTLCSVCKQVICVCGSEKTITSKFPSLSTEPKGLEPFPRYARGSGENGEDVTKYSTCKNSPDAQIGDLGVKVNGDDETLPEFSDSDILSSEHFSSLQRVFKKCNCTVKNPNCGCDFVKKLLNKFRMRLEKIEKTTEIEQTDSSPKLSPVQQMKPSADVQTDRLFRSSAVQGHVDVAVVDGACQTRNLCQKTMLQICIPPANNREPQENASKHISLQTLKDVFSQYTQTEYNIVNDKTQTYENHYKSLESQDKLNSQENIPGMPSTGSKDFSSRAKRDIMDQEVTENSRQRRETDQKVTQTEGNMLHDNHVEAKNIGIQVIPTLENIVNDETQTNENHYKSLESQDKLNSQENIPGVRSTGSKDFHSSRAKRNIMDQKVTNSRQRRETDQKVTQTEGNMLHENRVETKNIGIQVIPSLENIVNDKTQTSTQTNENHYKRLESQDKFNSQENIPGMPSTNSKNFHSSRAKRDIMYQKVTENSRQRRESGQKVTQTEGNMLHENRVETKNIGIQVIRSFENIGTGSSQKVQDKEDGLKESTLQNVELDQSKTERTIASSSHSSNVGPSAHTTASDSKSSASSRVTCFCCKQKAFLAEVSYLDEGNESLALCSRCFYQRPRYCSHNPRFMCRCWSYWRSTRNFDSAQYCKCCRKEASKCAKKLSGLMYTVTLPKHGSINKKRRSSRGNLAVENIKVQKGWSWKNLKNKENYYKRDDDRKNGLKKERRKKEVDENKDDEMEKNLNKKKQQKENGHDNNRNDDAQYTLMEYLIRNRPEFVYSAEHRRQMLLNSRILRERQKDNLKLNFLEDSLRNINADKYKLFTEREMKEINKKNYKKLPEVQGKLVNQRENRLRQADRLISNALAKKVQKSVLQGKGNFPIDKPLTNL